MARASSTLRGIAAVALLPALAVAQVQVSSPAPGIQLAYGINNGNPTALAVVNLCAPGVSVRTTRYEERGALAVDWAARTGVDLAVNGDLFEYGSYAVTHWARSGGVDWPPGTHNMEPHPNLSFGPGFAVRGEIRRALPSITTRAVTTVASRAASPTETSRTPARAPQEPCVRRIPTVSASARRRAPLAVTLAPT